MIELYKALHEARKAFSTVKKNSTNPHFKSKYADLESILDATEKSLDEKGLLVVTVIKNDNVETSLIHVETGQSIVSYYPLNTSLTDQQKGSAITYGRRYNMQSMLNLVAEDDDGNDASKDQKKPPVDDKKKEASDYYHKVKTWLSTQNPTLEALKGTKEKWVASDKLFESTGKQKEYDEILKALNEKIASTSPEVTT